MIFLIVFWAQKNERKKGISLNISIMKQKITEKKEERKKEKSMKKKMISSVHDSLDSYVIRLKSCRMMILQFSNSMMSSFQAICAYQEAQLTSPNLMQIYSRGNHIN